MNISEEDAAFDELEAELLEKELTAQGHKFQWIDHKLRMGGSRSLRWWPKESTTPYSGELVEWKEGPGRSSHFDVVGAYTPDPDLPAYKLIRVRGSKLAVLKAIRDNTIYGKYLTKYGR